MYTRNERIWMAVAQVIVFAVGLFLCLSAGAQSMPSIYTRDPEYWYNQYVAAKADADAAHTIATRLAENGTKAISGYKDALKVANDSLHAQSQIVATIVKDRNVQANRANNAEAALSACEGDKPKTAVGRWLRKVGNTGRDALAVIGGAVVTAGVIKLVWP